MPLTKPYEFIVPDPAELYTKTELNPKMRGITIEWMCTVVFDCHYRTEYTIDDPCIIQTAVKYFDMMMLDGGITKTNAQKMAAGAVSVAMKLHARYYVSAKDICYVSANTCTAKELFIIELDFLQKHGHEMLPMTVGIALIDLFEPYVKESVNTLCIYLFMITAPHDRFCKYKSRPLAVAIYALACSAVESVDAAIERCIGVKTNLAALPAIILDINTIWATDNKVEVDAKEQNLKYIFSKTTMHNPCNIKCLSDATLVVLTAGMTKKRAR